MILIVAYYLKDKPELIHFTSLPNIDIDDGFSRFINLDNYYNSKLFKEDLYSLKLDILQDYYGDRYKSEVVDNQKQYEKDFDEFFVFNYYVEKVDDDDDDE